MFYVLHILNPSWLARETFLAKLDKVGYRKRFSYDKKNLPITDAIDTTPIVDESYKN